MELLDVQEELEAQKQTNEQTEAELKAKQAEWEVQLKQSEAQFEKEIESLSKKLTDLDEKSD